MLMPTEQAQYSKDFTTFACMDDKHTCKVGGNKCPVQAVDHGKCVIVGLNESLQVSDHDHTKLETIKCKICGKKGYCIPKRS